jgi:hypothetical protein
MASKRSYLRKQREARLENEAKTRRTLEDLNWCINNETNSTLHNQGQEGLEGKTSNI